MGTNNRQRRRQKVKRRAEQRRRAGHTGGAPYSRSYFDDAAARIRDAWWVLLDLQPGDRRRAALELESAEVADVVEVAETMLDWIVAGMWNRGWQPTELLRLARREDPRVGRLMAVAIAADHLRRDRATMHPSWAAQADEITGVSRPTDGWLIEHLATEAKGRTFAMAMMSGAMRCCLGAMSLPELIPPPGTDPATWECEGEALADDPVLAKVRALLAQAESTTFEAEAEAFTAKAQELMARHAIDAAVVWARSERRDRPVSIRLAVDDPYADQKAQLLHVVAKNSRCKAVQLTGLGMLAVFGFRADLAAAELLYTSLLVQSQAAMRAEAASAPPGSHVRGATFRRAFLHGYAARIGHRLAAVNDAVQATADDEIGGASLLPVLVERDDAVAAAVHEQIGETEQLRDRRAYDRLGATRGSLAADRAEINPTVERDTANRRSPSPVAVAELEGRLF